MNAARLLIQLWMPIMIIILSVLEILVIPFLGGTRRRLRRATVRGVIFLTTLIMMSLYPQVSQGPIVYRISNIFGNGILFRIDLLSLLFMVFAGLVFLLVSIYTSVDIKDCGRERSFYLFFMVTFIATLGTFMAGDLLSFFLFFEIVTFASFALMVHERGQRVIDAGSIYIYMGIIGGLSILAGILILSAYTQNYEWVTLGEKFGEMGSIKYVAASLFIAGFGIKAGMVPLHHWVPVIYPRAHISVNALSSGVLMKVGGYGILRLMVTVISASMTQDTERGAVMMLTMKDIGAVVIWIGILTMVVGVVAALQQEKIVRMLAYHSVSQMGYVIMGIGVTAYLGYDGAMGFAGSVYHMVNHGLFKALLFMVAGVVIFRTKEKNMYNLGGLWRRMPFAATVGLIAVLGITGMPFFNGFASKSLLHHAIIEAFEHGHPAYRYAEILFMFVSAGTAASFIKLYSLVFLGKTPEKYARMKEKAGIGSVPMAILAILIVIIGIFPNLMMEGLLVPAARQLSFSPVFIDKYLVGTDFFNLTDFRSMATVYVIGFFIFFIGMRYHLFHFHLPKQLDLESEYYTPFYEKSRAISGRFLKFLERTITNSDIFIYGIMLIVLLLLLLRFL
jgi:formate hydrogenlyase subunit 3/multisubunit Na+/H+ antiporter MnhD subunit